MEKFELEVNYMTLNEMIKAGQYGSVSTDITEEYFPLPTEYLGKRVLLLAKFFSYDKEMKSEVVEKNMQQDGFRPATIYELLALGVTQPQLKDEDCIIALGSVWINLKGILWREGERGVPIIYLQENQVSLNLTSLDIKYPIFARFLGVKLT
jgi:hypothetical protein